MGNEKRTDNHYLVTTLCYIERDGQYLMLYRNKKKNDLNEGKWVGIGGKAEDGETPDECAIREVYEETGLILEDLHFHGVLTFVSAKYENEYMMLYSSHAFSGTLKEVCPEGELHWIPKEEVMALPTWEGDRYFLKRVLDGEDRIELKLVYDENDHLTEVLDRNEVLKKMKERFQN